MNKSNCKPYVFWIALSEVTGIIAGIITRKGIELYSTAAIKPPLSPPAILFPIVWTVLYALMGIGAARVYLTPNSSERTQGLLLFLVQLVFNFFWSIIFFNLQAYGFAFLWIIALWLLIILMTLTFYKSDELAAYLQIPYLLWVTFAGYLNLAVWILN